MMNLLNCNKSALVAFLCAMSLATISIAAPSTQFSNTTRPHPEVARVIAAIASQEKLLVNLRVDAKSKVENYDKRSNSWVYAGGQDVTGYYDGRPGGKARIDYHSQMSKWLNGIRPFAESVFSVAYNGRVGTKLYTRMGNKGTGIVPQGWIEAKPPLEIAQIGGYATGWSFSLYGLFNRESLSASRFFKKKPPRLARYTVFQGVHCIELLATYYGTRFSWWFDPARGFALLGKESTSRGGLIEKVIVEQLDNPAKGIYYPVKAVWEIGIDPHSGKPTQRVTYTATKVVANNPNFPSGIFTLSFPQGTQIHDQLTGRVFKAGPTTEGLAHSLMAQAREVRAARQTPPAVPGNSYWWWWILLVAACLVVIAAVSVLLRRKLHRHIPPLLAVCMLCLISNQATEVLAALTPSIREVPSIRFDNCGLNAVGFILDYFQSPLDISRLQREMGLGDHCENFASLEEIKNVLERKGFTVRAFKAATIDGFWANLGSDSVDVLYTAPEGHPAGHFYVVLGKLNEHALTVDPDVGWRWLTRDELRARLHGSFGGVWLVVAPAHTHFPTRSYPIFESTSKVKAQAVRRFGNLIAPVSFRNGSDQTVRVVKAKGDCGCFRGIRPQGLTLNPGGVGILSFMFDGSEFGMGDVYRDVALQLRAGSQTKTHLIQLDLSVVDPPGGRVIWVPHQIDFGLLRQNQKDLEMQTVALMLPSKFKVKGASATSGRVRVWIAGGRSPAAAESVKSSASHEVDVGIDVSQLPDGPFAERVIIVTTHPQYPRIVIPITGELRD